MNMAATFSDDSVCAIRLTRSNNSSTNNCSSCNTNRWSNSGVLRINRSSACSLTMLVSLSLLAAFFGANKYSDVSVRFNGNGVVVSCDALSCGHHVFLQYCLGFSSPRSSPQMQHFHRRMAWWLSVIELIVFECKNYARPTPRLPVFATMRFYP